MEENRWKPMQEGYDKVLFNKLFEQTKSLRKKLAVNIDKRRFGVEYDDIVSWFDTKFMYVFNKYYGEMDEDLLLGHIIKSLQFFQIRIIRSAYTLKNTQQITPVEDFMDLEEYALDNPWDTRKEEMLQGVLEFLSYTISDNAQVVLDILLNPPPYITERVPGKTKKIPNLLIADYMGLGSSLEGEKLIRSYTREIEVGIEKAKLHFKKF